MMIRSPNTAHGRGVRASQPITGVTFGTPYRYNQGYPAKYAAGDVWYNTWSDDNEIYTAAGDFYTGFSGVGPYSYYTAFSRLDGFSNSLTGYQTNTLREMGLFGETGSDGAGWTWKPSGLASVAGTLYMALSRQKYADAGSDYIQVAHDAQIIKSTDHGATWTPLPPGNAQPYASPMFPGYGFGAPGFIQYGKDYTGNGPHRSDEFIYATSSDGVWNNGSTMVLGRCLLSNLSSLNGANWQYWTGGDGLSDGNWSSTIGSASPIISNARKIGMAGAQYLPYCQRYVMFQWYYPSRTTIPPTLSNYDTWWDVYEAPTPWGPWTLIHSEQFNVEGWYSPALVHKSLTTDGGQHARLITSGNYDTYLDLENSVYQLTLMDVTFTN